MDTSFRSTDVCVDTRVCVNFAIVGSVELMVQIRDFALHVPQEVADEVTADAKTEAAGIVRVRWPKRRRTCKASEN